MIRAVQSELLRMCNLFLLASFAFNTPSVAGEAKPDDECTMIPKNPRCCCVWSAFPRCLALLLFLAHPLQVIAEPLSKDSEETKVLISTLDSQMQFPELTAKGIATYSQTHTDPNGQRTVETHKLTFAYEGSGQFFLEKEEIEGRHKGYKNLVLVSPSVVLLASKPPGEEYKFAKLGTPQTNPDLLKDCQEFFRVNLLIHLCHMYRPEESAQHWITRSGYRGSIEKQGPITLVSVFDDSIPNAAYDVKMKLSEPDLRMTEQVVEWVDLRSGSKGVATSEFRYHPDAPEMVVMHGGMSAGKFVDEFAVETISFVKADPDQFAPTFFGLPDITESDVGRSRIRVYWLLACAAVIVLGVRWKRRLMAPRAA